VEYSLSIHSKYSRSHFFTKSNFFIHILHCLVAESESTDDEVLWYRLHSYLNKDIRADLVSSDWESSGIVGLYGILAFPSPYLLSLTSPKKGYNIISSFHHIIQLFHSFHSANRNTSWSWGGSCIISHGRVFTSFLENI
jgi:hypothetical protein